VWVVGCRIPACGWPFSGGQTRGFWLGEVDDGVWWLRQWWTHVAGGPVVSSRPRRVADGGDTRRWPLVARERKREIEKRVRERGAVGESGLRYPTSTPLFIPFSFFWAQLTSFN